MCFPKHSGVQAVFEELGIAALLDDPRFVDSKTRIANKEAVNAALSEAFSKDTAAHWAKKIGARGVPISRVNTIAEAIEDPQLAHRGTLVDVPPPQGFDDPVRLVGSPHRAISDGPRIDRPPPGLGEHGAEVLGGLGFTATEIEDLVAAGAVGRTPD